MLSLFFSRSHRLISKKQPPKLGESYLLSYAEQDFNLIKNSYMVNKKNNSFTFE